MKLRKILLIGALFLALCPVAMAGDGISTPITTTTGLVTFADVSGKGKAGEPFRGCVNLYGTFNSATIHWLVSTDDGTTKSPMRNLSGDAVTSTEADSFCFQWGFPSSQSDHTIFFASVSGALSAPSLSIDLFDNR